MDLKLARVELDAKPKTISLDKLLAELEKDKEKIFYFDKSNAHKDLVAAVEKFEEMGYSVYFKEIRYGLDEEDYMYQVHIL